MSSEALAVGAPHENRGAIYRLANGAGAKPLMQCCNKADYHTQYEICCDWSASRPAPFLWSQADAVSHRERFFLRSVQSRTTVTRGFDHTDNFGPDVELSYNHWGENFFPFRYDACAET